MQLGERRLVVPAGNAPASSGYRPEALLLSYETVVNWGFQAKPLRGTENDIHLPGWPDSHGAERLVAPAKEQLALIAENGLHGLFFR